MGHFQVPINLPHAATLTKPEQDAFKNAITKAIKDGIYARLVQIHADMMHDMHTLPGMPAAFAGTRSAAFP